MKKDVNGNKITFWINDYSNIVVEYGVIEKVKGHTDNYITKGEEDFISTLYTLYNSNYMSAKDRIEFIDSLEKREIDKYFDEVVIYRTKN